MVGVLRRGEQAVRRGGRRAGQRGRPGLGARLPAAAGAPDAARPPAGPADRLLPAHPVPAGRAVPAAAVAAPAPRGAARRRPGRLPAAGRRGQLRPAGPPAGRPQDPPRPRLPVRRPDRAGRGVPDLDRRRRLREAGPVRRGHRPGQGDPQRARRAAQDLPRRRPARLHQGHLRPAARLRRAPRGRPLRRRGRRLRAGRGALARAGRGPTASSATRSTAWSAGSTATWAGSVSRRSATCTPPTPARRWPPSTAPPTSWWSRPTATG